ncbi:MAG: hypothetical protein ACYC7E_11330 [Armatimonadota bacterium]
MTIHGRKRSETRMIDLLSQRISPEALRRLSPAALSTYFNTRCQSIAADRAQQEIEYAQRIGYDSLDPDNPKSLATYYPPGYVDLPTGRGVRCSEQQLPNGACLVRVTNFRTFDNVLMVTVQVTWDGPSPGHSKVRIATLIAR